VLLLTAPKPPDDKYLHETAVSQCVKLGPAEHYALSADFLTLAAPSKRSTNKVDLTWYTSDDCVEEPEHGTWIFPSKKPGEWQQLIKTKLFPILGAKSARISVAQNGRHSNGATAIWDNILFEPSGVFVKPSRNELYTAPKDRFPIGDNYLHNADFLKTIDGWHPSWPTQWVNSSGRYFPGAAQVTAKSTTGGIGRGAFDQCIDLAGNRNFEGGISYAIDQRSTQKGGGRFRVTWYSEKNCRGRSKSSRVNSDIDKANPPGWHELKLTGLKAPETARSAIFTVIQSVRGPGEFIVQWDDAYFIAVE